MKPPSTAIQAGDKVMLRAWESGSSHLTLLDDMRPYIGTQAIRVATDADMPNGGVGIRTHDGVFWFWPVSAMEKVS
jgi:hypothetical protein